MSTFFGIPLKNHEESELTDTHRMVEIFDFLRPKKSSYPLVRIGDGRDGTYLIPDDLEGISACFSPGVNNFKDFEDILTEKYNIKCHMCDFSSDLRYFRTPLKASYQTFLKKWLDIQTSGDSISLADWVTGLAPTGDLILQIDIEGAEYRNIINTPASVLSRFRIIVMEVHSLYAMQDIATLHSVFSPFFSRLEEFFECIHVHPNNAQGDFLIPGTSIRVPGMLEITLLRKDRQKNPVFLPEIPHPLDIGRNVKEAPPVFLSEQWIDFPRTIDSQIKILSDKIDYIEFQDLGKKYQSLLAFNEILLRSFGNIFERLAAENLAVSLREIAKGRPYKLSSSYIAGQNSGHVEPNDKFFFHTGFGVNQFIQIDLGTIQHVQKITIRNRSDGCFDRASALFAVLSLDAARCESFTVPLAVPEAFLNGHILECEMIIPITPARYVTILSPLETALHFSDLKIYAIEN